MRSFVYFILTALLIFNSCSKEKEVTIKHPMSVEFGQDPLQGGKISVVFLDYRGTSATPDQIAQTIEASVADLLLVACDQAFEVHPDSHKTFYKVGGLMGFTSVDNAYFEAMTLPSGDKLVAELCGYSLLIGDISDDDSNQIIQSTIQSGLSSSWIIILPSECGVLTDYTFTDCFSAQSSVQDTEGLVRDHYLYASQGVWSRMSYIEENPLRFSLNLE